MQPLSTKVYLLKRYSPSDNFCTFLSRVCHMILQKCRLMLKKHFLLLSKLKTVVLLNIFVKA